MRVRSVSLSGTGQFSEIKYIEINNSLDKIFVAEIIVATVLLLIFMALAIYCIIKFWSGKYKCKQLKRCNVTSFTQSNETDRDMLLLNTEGPNFDIVIWNSNDDTVQLRSRIVKAKSYITDLEQGLHLQPSTSRSLLENKSEYVEPKFMELGSSAERVTNPFLDIS